MLSDARGKVGWLTVRSIKRKTAHRLPSLSTHLVVDDSCFNDGHAPQILDQVQACLGGLFDVEHSTFQFEHGSHVEHELAMH